MPLICVWIICASMEGVGDFIHLAGRMTEIVTAPKASHSRACEVGLCRVPGFLAVQCW